jgi:lysozyme
MRYINQAGLKLLMSSEGCRLTAYPDPGTGGDPWTCGFGSTGPDIVPGTVWTQADADKRLMEDLTKFEKAVDELVKVELSENQWSAIICFVYNVGIEAFRRSTLLRLINQRDFVGASRQFLLWTKAKDSSGKPRVLPGLVMRRRNEAALFMRPDRG